MTSLYPLRFRPLTKRAIWGGRRLKTVLGKDLPAGDDFAESWEICDRAGDQSVVAAGPLAGASLGELVRERGRELLGRHHPQARFPLLVKFIDARRDLSVQVHPDDRRAARLTPPDLGKTEAWVVMDAELGSRIYAGLAAGHDQASLEQLVAEGNCEQALHAFEPRVGDCIFLPAGTIHAIGAGLLVAEIQQSSDVTYRLYDWNRLGADGKPRQLHLSEALEAIDYSAGPVVPQLAEPTASPGMLRLIACDKFILEQRHVAQPSVCEDRGTARILIGLDGAVGVAGDADSKPLRRGETLLLPASLGPVELTPDPTATFLFAYLP
jgi:mannose-6-phosphate isomerase